MAVSVFDLIVPNAPSAEPRPLLVEIPHAGLTVPDELSAEVIAAESAIKRDADIFVDRLYARAPELGASLLVANMSRYVVDLNRAQTDVDVATVSDHPAPGTLQPRGVVWRATTDGQPILRRPLTYARLTSRLRTYYVPYHEALGRTLAEMRERYGYALLLAAHSMPSAGRALHKDRGTARADVVPGSRGRTSASPRVIDLVDAHFREAGLSVRHDDPYQGGFSTTFYGRPSENVHAIQIELNRALYVDEVTFEPKLNEMRELTALLDALVARLGALDPRQA
jgi:N-formylglutamate amidohydrolase